MKQINEQPHESKDIVRGPTKTGQKIGEKGSVEGQEAQARNWAVGQGTAGLVGWMPSQRASMGTLG